MMKHIDIDEFVSYLKKIISDTKQLINPAHKKMSEFYKTNLPVICRYKTLL